MNKTDELAEELARWMPDAFSSLSSSARRHDVKWPEHFGPSERQKFRKVARALLQFWKAPA